MEKVLKGSSKRKRNIQFHHQGPNSPQTPKTTMKLMRQASAIFTQDEISHLDTHESIEQSVLLGERPWYKEAIFYEVYVRAFCDSNGDGHGDIPG